MKRLMKILMIVCAVWMNADSYAEDLYEITESCILDPNIAYYVPSPPLLIHGEINVVIPSGTTIVIAEDWDYGIIVYDGAKIDTGEPAPVIGDPNSAFEPTLTYPPVRIIGESGMPFFNNYCGILVYRTASTKCQLKNIYLSGFEYAMFIDQQLDSVISNIYSFGNYSGIVSFGSNRFLNCYVSYFGLFTQEYQVWGYAYIGDIQTLDGSPLNGSKFIFKNCLADDGDDGFTVYGSMDPDAVPDFEAWDCVATNCYSGFNGWSGNVAFSIICPGLYNNVQNKNFPEMPFTDPVYEVNDPFVVDVNDYRIFLNPDSNFVDHGSGLSSCPGWTTRIDSQPDDGIGDIWPHYQTSYLNLLSADFDLNHVVDANDLAEFTYWWLIADPDSADFNADGIVNFVDFSVFASQWQRTELYIEMFNPDTLQAVDSKNVSGYVGISLKNIPSDGGIISVYVDNMQIGGWMLGWNDELQLIGFESAAFSNGWHTIGLISTSLTLGVTNYEPINVYFNNLLYKVSASDQFHPDEDYRYSGFYDGDNSLEAKVTDEMSGLVIWSDTYSGQHINMVIPGSIFGTSQFCELTITEIGGTTATMGESGTAMAASSSSSIAASLTKKFKKEDCPAGVKMIMVLPHKAVYKVRKPAIIECAKSCDLQNVVWVALYRHNVNKENLSYLYNKSSVKFIYWCGHANSHVGAKPAQGIEGVQRTHTMCWELDEGWIWDSWKERGVFSFTNGEEPLPDDWDNRGFSLWSLGMHEEWNKKIVFVDGCLSIEYWDMAAAYGMFSWEGEGSKDQLYIGWRIKVLVSTGIMETIVGNTTEGIRMFWEQMGKNKSVKYALEYTSTYGGAGMQRAMWGLNGMPDFFDIDGDDNIFVVGNGIVNFNSIKLQP